MCGIIGLTGKKDFEIETILTNGLKKLDYRGYDSAGLSYILEDGIATIKAKGKLNNLIKKISTSKSKTGIAHTRWATHGKPCTSNAHPHNSNNNMFSVVHNGIIENMAELKHTLTKYGFRFKSETDSEVIPNLIQHYYSGNFLAAVLKSISKLKGSFAIAVISSYSPNKIITAKKDSPLIVCKNKDGLYLASDIPALLNFSSKLYVLENNEVAILNRDKNKINFLNFEGEKIKKQATSVSQRPEMTEMGNFNSFMEKEINEIPETLKNTLNYYKNKFNWKVLIEKLKNASNIFYIGCGTAYNAGLVGAGLSEDLCKIKSYNYIASEFRYSNTIIPKNSVCIFISQSGETADTLKALEKAKSLGAFTIAITNVETSSITRIADAVMLTKAGIETAVASTKAYNNQLLVLMLITLKICEENNLPCSYNLKDLENLSEVSKNCINLNSQIKQIANERHTSSNVFFIGRGLDSYTSFEASLKLKEICYLSSEGYPAGELKHGTLSLIDKNSLVIAIITNPSLKEKTLNALHEVRARGAKTLVISSLDINSETDYYLKLPNTSKHIMPLLSVIPCQLLALEFCLSLNLNPDKPRNLAKSVTVE